MTPMRGAFDWLAVGDLAEERGADHQLVLGGAAARLTAHAAGLKAHTTLVAKVGDDEAGRRLRDALARLKVDLHWLRETPDLRTKVWHDPDGEPQQRRVERGADLALRLDELPSRDVRAAITVVSGYSLSVEPARSAVLGALTAAGARGGRSALLLEADLLWWTNARMTRRVLEPALARSGWGWPIASHRRRPRPTPFATRPASGAPASGCNTRVSRVEQGGDGRSGPKDRAVALPWGERGAAG